MVKGRVAENRKKHIHVGFTTTTITYPHHLKDDFEWESPAKSSAFSVGMFAQKWKRGCIFCLWEPLRLLPISSVSHVIFNFENEKF